MVAQLKFYRIVNLLFAVIVTSAFLIALFQAMPEAPLAPPATPKPTFMGDLVRGVVFKPPPPPPPRSGEAILPECHGEEPNHRHRVSVQTLQDMLLHRELRTMIDVGAGKGHYSFMAASAGATVYSFSVHGNALYEKSPVNRRTDWRLNDEVNPQTLPYVDLMIIQEWHPYEYQQIIHHCLQNTAVRIIVVINHSAQCTAAMIEMLKTRYHYTCRNAAQSYQTCNK